MTEHQLLHTLWTKAVGTERYDKAEWKELERVLGVLEHPAARQDSQDVTFRQLYGEKRYPEIVALEAALKYKAGQAIALNELTTIVHKANAKWWLDLDTGQPIQRNVGELLMLAVTELAEALEGHRKNLQDDKLPRRKMFEVELADCIIRIFDMAAGLHLDLGGAFVEKMAYNAARVDHTLEHRRQEGGKKY
jgi:NTP pyrophosphatase (non-canonical NTP hydrolase)